jgi:hypothetical protein
MNADNNNVINVWPCVCGSLTHRRKRSKVCPLYVNTSKSHDEKEKDSLPYNANNSGNMHDSENNYKEFKAAIVSMYPNLDKI